MKKSFKILMAVILTLMVIIPSAAFMSGAFTPELCECVTSDIEGCVGSVYYQMDENSLVYSIENDGCNKEYLTDYAANNIAVMNGGIYVSAGNKINFINLENKESETVFEGEGNIVKFAVTEKKIYVLDSGKIISRGLSGLYEKTEVDGNVIDFWLEDSNTFSYMINDEMIYTLDLVNDETESDVNFKSDLGEGLVVTDNTQEIETGTQTKNKVGSGISLNALENKFPDGKYWNHEGDINSPDSYTSKPCTHHGNCTYSGSCGCNSYSSCIQCMGYAFKCGYDTTGYNPNTLEGDWTISRDSDSIDSVKPGDIIRYRNDSHSIFVIAVSGNTISFTDCNSDWNCNIRWNGTVSKTTVKSSFTKLYKSPYNAGVYTIKFDAGEGTVETTSISVVEDEVIGELPIPTREGYGFVGWFTTPDEDGEEVTAESIYENGDSTTLYAHWKKNTYKVMFVANAYDPLGEEDTVSGMPEDQTKEYNVTLTVNTGTRLTRKGYSFRGWNTEADGSGTKYTADFKYKGNADLTLYGMWDMNSTSLRFHATDVTLSYTEAQCYYGSPYSEAFTGNTKKTTVGLPTPTKTGYDFVGWCFQETEEFEEVPVLLVDEDGNPVLDSKGKQQEVMQTVSKDVIITNDDICLETGRVDLYARWKEKEYKITYDANAGSDETVKNIPDSQVKTYFGSGVKLITTTALNSSKTPERVGYDFLGWSTSKVATKPDYVWGTSYTYSTNSELNLYAVWSEKKYTISFDANYSGAAAITEKVYKLYSETAKITATIPTRTGYEFTGWNTKANGSGTTYKDKATYKNNEDVTLYAQWKAKTFTVKFNPNGSSDYPLDAEFTYDGTYGTLPTIARKGYTFGGWQAEESTTVSDNAKVAITKDQTFTAIWSSTVTVNFDADEGTCDRESDQFNYGEKFGILPVAEKDGFVFVGWYDGETLITADDICTWSYSISAQDSFVLKAKYYEIPAEGEGLAVYVVGDEFITKAVSEAEPQAPEKDGYSVEWDSGTAITRDTVEIGKIYKPVYTAKEYKVTISYPNQGGSDKSKSLTDEITVKCGEKISFASVSSDGIHPDKAAKTGYNFIGWKEEIPTVMPAENVELTANYKAIEYTVVYKGATGVIDTQTYTLDDTSLSLPEIPNRVGYTSKWPSYEIAAGGMTINAVYTPIVYTVTLNIDGNIYETKFTVESREIVPPEAAERTGYYIELDQYVISAENKTINGKYVRDAEIEILNYHKSRAVSYFGEITLRPEITGTQLDAKIVWKVDGETAEANSDGSLTLSNLKGNHEVKVQLVENGEVISESETEKLTVNTKFFVIVKAFFKKLFGKIKPIVQ